jgi:hypothetical protein
MSPDKDVDFLRLRLPTEIATAPELREVIVHPSFCHHQQYNAPALTSNRGREMR